MANILVIGAGGQLGTELTRALADKHGNESVIATDANDAVKDKFSYCRFEKLNVLDRDALIAIVKNESIQQS